MLLGVVAIVASTAWVVGADAAPGATVRIQNIDFHSSRVTVHRGRAVTWRFLDRDVVHNVTSFGRLRFRSSPTKRNGIYTVRFTKSGVYRYRCTIHPNMRGSVVVR